MVAACWWHLHELGSRYTIRLERIRRPTRSSVRLGTRRYLDGLHYRSQCLRAQLCPRRRLQDRFGPLPCSIAGSLLISLGFYLSSFTTSLSYLYLCLGVIGGIGSGFGYSTPIPVMAKWFPDKRSLAVGIAVGGYGAGSAIFGPLAQLKLIPAYGLPATFQILAAVFLVMTIAGALLLRNPPAGYRPEGWSPAAVSRAAFSADFTPSEVLRTRTFYLMWIAYALGPPQDSWSSAR
jgi:MFS transporter, OFA family, oxalate/formate antiporter